MFEITSTASISPLYRSTLLIAKNHRANLNAFPWWSVRANSTMSERSVRTPYKCAQVVSEFQTYSSVEVDKLNGENDQHLASTWRLESNILKSKTSSGA